MTERSRNRRDSGLRGLLRRETDAAHRLLDDCLHPFATGDDAAYAQFLAVQYAARSGMEKALAPLPPTSALIAQDLAELGMPIPAPIRFALPAGGLVGAQWALAGSALGNRQILAERARYGELRAVRFIQNNSGAVFFRDLLPMLADELTGREEFQAVRGALSVFDSFLAAAAFPVLSKAA